MKSYFSALSLVIVACLSLETVVAAPIKAGADVIRDTPETIKVMPSRKAPKPEAILEGKWRLQFGTLPELVFTSGRNSLEIYGLRPADGQANASLVLTLNHHLLRCFGGRVSVVFKNGDKFTSKIARDCSEDRIVVSNFKPYAEIGQAIEDSIPIAIQQGKNIVRLKATGIDDDIERFKTGIDPKMNSSPYQSGSY